MQDIDLDDFRAWAVGNLVDNRNRGIFAEWLVGQALNVVNPNEPRSEWDLADLRYRERLIEVKASGRGQTWSQAAPSIPRFDIASRIQAWDAATGTWEAFDTPRRVADVYVFCLHKPHPATNNNVADPQAWEFWVVATSELNHKLGNQRSVGVSTLDTLRPKVVFPALRSTVDDVIASSTN
jgi:hypothetical protein